MVPSDSDTSILPDKVKPTQKNSIDIEEGEHRIGLSGSEAIKDIEQKDYHATDISKQISEIT